MADGKKRRGVESSLFSPVTPDEKSLPERTKTDQLGGRRQANVHRRAHCGFSQEGVSVRRGSAEPHFALSLGASVDPACSLLPQVCPGPQRHSLACRSGSSFSVSLKGACLCQPSGPSGDTTGTDPHWLVGRFVASRSFGCSLLRSPVAVPVPSLCPPP